MVQYIRVLRYKYGDPHKKLGLAIFFCNPRAKGDRQEITVACKLPGWLKVQQETYLKVRRCRRYLVFFSGPCMHICIDQT